MAQTALEPAANLSFRFRYICPAAYMALPSPRGACRARVAKAYLYIGRVWHHWVCIGVSLGDHVRVEKEAHTCPEVVKGRAQAHIRSFEDHHSSQPCHHHNSPRLFVPSFEATIAARILPNVKSRECRSDRVLTLF